MKKFCIVATIFSVVCLSIIFTSCVPKDYEQSDMDKNVRIIYAEAVNLGYEGTLEEFLSTIKGVEGVGVSDVYIDASGRLFVLLTDDTLLEVGEVKGKDGVDGVGIVDIIKNESDEIIVTLTNGVKKNLGKVTSGKDGRDGVDGINGVDGTNGRDGVDGVGISSIIRNEDDEIIVTLTDGTIKNLGKVLNGKDGADGKDGINGADGKDGKDGVNGKDGTNGADGKDGKDGADGINGKNGRDGTNGADGKDGKDGVGIVDIVRNENDEIIVILSDDTTKNLGKVTDGKDGENGKDGTNGADGKDGINGKDGTNGADGKDGLSAYELYLKYHPEYKGSEREWVEEMFGGVKEFTVTVKYGDKQENVVVKRGDAVDLSGIDVTRDGYAFVKWTTEAGGDFDASSPISSDTIIVAKYRKVTQYVAIYSDITVENDSVAIINISADNSAALNGVTFSATSGIIKIKVSYAGSDYEIEHNFADKNSLSNPNLNALLESGEGFALEITYYDGDGLTVTPIY